MKTFDQKLYDYLIDCGISSQDMNSFLYPKIDDLLDPFDLTGMAEAVDKINSAIKQNKKILVFGDYDCDGISATAILILHLRQKGANVVGFIPNRFDDGYGLSEDTIDEISQKYAPDLMITVDLGITAVKEVEELKRRNIDVVVTDHHEPTGTLPNCIVIDAKVDGQKYAFNGLCGAGIALKLVEALDGRACIEQYLDICAIATIGDIVPLVSENRVIAKLGLEKINCGDCHESIKFLLEKLNLTNISSEDVSFRIVPRLNSSGRMSNSKKVLDFLIETDKDKLENLYAEIETDNDERLKEIASGNLEITERLADIDIDKNNAILAVGDFHQGVLGILASRICHEFDRPTIVFTETENHTYKGSGRSVGTIDIHAILSGMQDRFIRFGGHKMAVGLEIEKDKFDEFKKDFNYKLEKAVKEYHQEQKTIKCIEISEEDINMKFAKQFHMLEPFGCENERPTLMLKTNNLIVEQMRGKNFRHYKINLPTGEHIVAFGAYKYVELLKNPCEKKLYLDLDISFFGGKKVISCKLNNVEYADTEFCFDKETVLAGSILNRYISIKNTNSNLVCNHMSSVKLIEKVAELGKNYYGTLVVCQDSETLKKLYNNADIKANYTFGIVPNADRKNCIIISSKGVQLAEPGYKNYVYLNSAIRNEHYLFDSSKTVYDLSLFDQNIQISGDKNLMAKCYKVLQKNYQNIFANTLFDYCEKLSFLAGGIGKAQMMFAILVFADLGIIKISGFDSPIIEIVEGVKTELFKSKLYNELWKK